MRTSRTMFLVSVSLILLGGLSIPMEAQTGSVAAARAAAVSSQDPAQKPSSLSESPPQTKFYMLLFSSEGSPNIARLSHGFATFMKTEISPRIETFEDFTISWMPADLDVRFQLRPEPGRNLDLPASFEYVRSVNGRTFAWGPFEINKELYDRAVQQFERIEARRQMYKMVDFRFKYRPGVANNCYHTVTDIAPTGLISTGTTFGEPYGWIFVRHFRPWMINPDETHDWLVDMLGLRRSDITFRKNGSQPAPAMVGGN